MTTPDYEASCRLWHEMWNSAENDVDRYRMAWESARGRAKESNRKRETILRALDDQHHRLLAELDRNKELSLRIYQLETELMVARARRSLGWGQQ